ncbi:DUF1800 domain-containing protein [Sulfitobacter sp. D35]|uniref:DUF1800 domain-containing protein n=1 Tax=Sulfitobacter sp. D35 TaxID=3083252 RepID=UPI00296E386C|nr:DUF1800 domain-containing protein [Sulfitobacter sp. D35]MDW4498989.1 DUF1800 domain-containing protein [Sulfitobacter sp. D35]
MARYDPEFAEMRFGLGLSPLFAPAVSPEAMLAGLSLPDRMAERYPIDGFEPFRKRVLHTIELQKSARALDPGRKRSRLEAQRAEMLGQMRGDQLRWFGQTMLRRIHTDSGLRERLVFFWSDHFTARGKIGGMRYGSATFVEDAIRPNVTGRFADLLIAAVTHPVMLQYLDQTRSVGPNSRFARDSEVARGLNENLAREVLELHTLGVDGPYGQADVRQLAELFTGLSYRAQSGFRFRPRLVEPGEETVLGVTYPDVKDLEAVRRVLEDLARHPATAVHVARQLAVHFVSDAPDPALVDHAAARFRDTDGDLMSVYAALLEHPAAWAQPFVNVKFPLDFISSALRALALPPEAISGLLDAQMRGWFLRSLGRMGQPWETVIEPDGWTEEDNEWLTPQGLAARVEWAMAVPRKLMDVMPDPRRFVVQALGRHAPPEVVFAASAAESQSEAIGLVLCCPHFQRR